PAILPPYARRSRSLEVLIPILYLKGISTGDFEETLAALLGKDAPGLSASTIARLKEVWLDEHEHWQKRDLSAKLGDPAQKSWRRLDGHNQLPKLIQGVTFTDGIEVAVNPASSRSQTAAA